MSLKSYITHFLFAILLLPCTFIMAQADIPALPYENETDKNGWRQGYWQITGDMTRAPGYKKTQVVEEGTYHDNKRIGTWKKYYPTGELRSEIAYDNNLPRGPYNIYYANGNLEETGEWQNNKNTGAFKRYHENGQVAQEFYFNKNGKRDGIQNYFYANGQLQMRVEIMDGAAHGAYSAFYPNGDIKEEKRLINGEVEPGSNKTYPAKGNLSTAATIPELPTAETTPSSNDKPNLEVFKQTGFNTLYNRDLQMTQVGEFKNGKLWNGKWHRYDENGLLKKVEVYKNGRFIGYGIIDEGFQ
jgi:antitoxin component YwqK of YwqJK toxin-antitoxin module